MMNIKNLLIGLSTTGLVAASLSLSACSGGSASPLANTVPSPVATLETPPSGYSLPVGTAANTSTVYISSSGTTLQALALPQGIATSALQISAPSGIALDNLISAFVQQFTSSPLVLVISSITGGVLVNVSASSLNPSALVSVKAATPVTWNPYVFNNIMGTSTPVAVAANDGVYMGVNTNQGGGFLALQASSSESSGALTFVATPTQCNTQISTSAISIGDTTLTSGNYIGIGTNAGEVLIYGVNGSNAGQCENLTKASQAAQQYTPSSPIGALSFTATSTNNYGYFATQSGQIWQIIATTANKPQHFNHINDTNTYSGAPTSSITALYSDKNNNVYVGTGNGMIYLLPPFNSAGNVNTNWTNFQLLKSINPITPDNSAVTSISSTTNGQVIAVTAAGVYNISIVAQ